MQNAMLYCTKIQLDPATDATTWDMHEQNNARTSPSINSHAPFGHWTADDKQYSFSTPH